jgi:hypothetical protein
MRIFLMASLVFSFVKTEAQSIPANTGSKFKASEAKILLDRCHIETKFHPFT